MQSVSKITQFQWQMSEIRIWSSWWNAMDGGKLKYWERNLSHCHFAYHKSCVNCPWMELGPLWWEAGVCLSHDMAWSSHLLVVY